MVRAADMDLDGTISQQEFLTVMRIIDLRKHQQLQQGPLASSGPVSTYQRGSSSMGGAPGGAGSFGLR